VQNRAGGLIVRLRPGSPSDRATRFGILTQLLGPTIRKCAREMETLRWHRGVLPTQRMWRSFAPAARENLGLEHERRPCQSASAEHRSPPSICGLVRSPVAASSPGSWPSRPSRDGARASMRVVVRVGARRQHFSAGPFSLRCRSALPKVMQILRAQILEVVRALGIAPY
jgi:hypothetical protein